MLKKLLSLIIVIVGFLWLSLVSAGQSSWQVCFTPQQHCRPLITSAVARASTSIKMQAYSFTSYAIAKALVRASTRGVDVKIIVDKSDLINFSQIYYLLKHKIPIWLDNKVRIAHNKVMIIDHKVVITGSYNFTNAAEYHNAENLLLINNQLLVEKYVSNWSTRQQQSIRLTRKNVKHWRKITQYAERKYDRRGKA